MEIEGKEKRKSVEHQLVTINFGLILCICGLSSQHFLYVLNSLPLLCTISLSLCLTYAEWERT